MAGPHSYQIPSPGSLLVASPALEDPNFHQAVVLMLAFSATDGALGVILNRPNDVPVASVLPEWDDLSVEPRSMFVGGPVSRESVITLGKLRPERVGTVAERCAPVPSPDDRLVSIDLYGDAAEVAAAVGGLRLFSGYAGWSAGQLDGELAAGGWLVLRATIDDPLTDDPSGLWRRVLARQGGHVAIYANAPPKLSMN